MNDCTLIIQGPLHKHSLDHLVEYKELFQNVFISCWNTDDRSIVLDDNQFIISNDTYISNTTFNLFNTYYQFFSTYAGILSTNTKYVIKVRSDNYIGGIQKFIDIVLKNPNKFVCSNLYFRPDSVAKFHPSDQIIGGTTENMLKAFKIMIYRMENHSKELREAYNDGRMLSNDKFLYYKGMLGTTVENASEVMERGCATAPEVLLGTSCVAALGRNPSIIQSKGQMKQTFEIVRLEEMFPYINKEGNSTIQYSGPQINDISDI